MDTSVISAVLKRCCCSFTHKKKHNAAAVNSARHIWENLRRIKRLNNSILITVRSPTCRLPPPIHPARGILGCLKSATPDKLCQELRFMGWCSMTFTAVKCFGSMGFPVSLTDTSRSPMSCQVPGYSLSTPEFAVAELPQLLHSCCKFALLAEISSSFWYTAECPSIETIMCLQDNMGLMCLTGKLSGFRYKWFVITTMCLYDTLSSCANVAGTRSMLGL